MATDLHAFHDRSRAALLRARGAQGHWRGELSSSALSTATAVAALARAAPGLASVGRAWLAAHGNPDGGFGDTVASPSNLSTTALAWMALGEGLMPFESGAVRVAWLRAEGWLEQRLGQGPQGGVSAAALSAELERVYGEDRTFAVPILTACAVGGAFRGERDPWRSVRALPFELAALPQGLFRFLGLPVVSYALPALIAIGQAVEHHRPTPNPVARLARRTARARTLRVLERIQPANGGFLEATPLTSFVALSLASIGAEEHPVTRRCVAFLEASVRADGSWPIDTDLATWVTSLAVGALGGRLDGGDVVAEWLLAQQHRTRHAYTGAAPGGWAWTDLPGGVPDADDTPAALLALRRLGGEAPGPRMVRAAELGLGWLTELQNRDGGMPTFCRGWGSLPFDMSCADLTAHALRAADAWGGDVSPRLRRRLARLRARAQSFLVDSQADDGSWTPLWFGNQHAEGARNPVYGTSRVLRAASTSVAPGLEDRWRRALARGAEWLAGAQGADGGFGGAPGVPPTIEETALALEALAEVRASGTWAGSVDPAIQRAVEWLDRATDGGRRFPASPIGLYFAQLWYDEALYPLAFTVSALRLAADLEPS